MTLTISHEMLAPAAALVLWTLIILLYTAIMRFAAFKTANIDLRKVPPGGRGQDLESILPKPIMWPSHNYSHLVEQPTLFYALCFALQFLDQANDINIGLAWLYVALRVVHSLVQGTVNIIIVRFLIFVTASVVLMMLAVHAAIGVGMIDASFLHH